MENIKREPETVVITVPSQPRYARVVRMTAANLASMLGMDVNQVEDVRMAAEEAFVYACATDAGSTCNVRFTVSDEALTLDFDLGEKAVTEDAQEPGLVYAAFILEAVCDECVITDAPNASMHLVKRIGAR